MKNREYDVQEWEDDLLESQGRKGAFAPYLKERVGVAQRRWNTLLFGRATIDGYLRSQVRPYYDC